MTMHFNVIDYTKYDIEKPPVDLGEIKYEFDQKNYDYMYKQLQDLQAFDYNSLSYRQQYDYEALEYSLYETLADYQYYRYHFLFDEGSNLADNIISNFTDYTFYDLESLDDYITCLKDFDRYFNDALAYTSAQADDGLPLIDPWIDYTVEVCEGVLNKKEDNTLITTFNDRINEVDFIDDAKKAEYIEQNKKIVLEEVLPAYENLAKEITKYYGKAKIDDYALYKLDKNYAELKYILKGSNNDNLDIVFQQLQDNLSLLEAQYASSYYDEEAYKILNDALDANGTYFTLTGKDCLEYLRKNLNEYYPDLGDVEYNVDPLDPDTASSTIIAYYWPSPIDDSNQNIIKTNPNNMSEGYETYGTLAHEGFPGHLYQHVYFSRTNPHNFRSAISFIGYTEGWAVNAQKYSFKFAGVNNDTAEDGLFFEDAYYFILYSIIDLGVNYYGWKASDISEYFEKESMVFSFDTETAKSFREFIIEMPGVYCSYGIGLSNFLSLCEETQLKLGDKFDYIKYHETLLKNGPLPFNILKGAVKEYIASAK